MSHIDTANASLRMRIGDAMSVIRDIRQDAVVVTAMRAALEWANFPPHPRDLIYLPSSMGQASSVALGIALAQPETRVIVVNGDGSTLMNLGSLVTITSQAPSNLSVVVTDNGVYDITGCQHTAASEAARSDGQPVCFEQVARACGFETSRSFSDLDNWRGAAGELLFSPGPVFACLKVVPQPESGGAKSPGPGPERIQRLQAELTGAGE